MIDSHVYQQVMIWSASNHYSSK